MTRRFALPKALGIVLLVLVITGAAAGGWSVYIQQTGNVHAVEDGRVYRSNTLGAPQLKEMIEGNGIKTILNLRGGSVTDAWYAGERQIAASHGVQYIDLPMSEDSVPDPALMDQLVKTLGTAQQPILIHCKAGADRTGLASALYEYLYAGKSAEEASRQLSFYFGHFPWLTSKTGAMDTAFWQLVSTHTATDMSPVGAQ